VPPAERQILVAPDAIARAAASMAPDRESAWMLRQPRDLRRSFANEVFGRPDEDLRQQVWMLHQPREVRESFVEHVLLRQDDPPRDQIWMLLRDDAECRSYARYVLLEDDDAL
jgi:hypothetical protein